MGKFAMKILLTGGAGYIGSHCYCVLKEAGHQPILLDNFSNSSRRVLERLRDLFQEQPVLLDADVRDEAALVRALEAHQPDAVIHFAGLKAVGESVVEPLKYFSNNVAGSQALFSAMQRCGIQNLVFSSSATVYGVPDYLPLDEAHPLSATNPYGLSKLMVEDMLRALHVSDPKWSIVMLRYFNPVGAHPSGLIGEDPQGIPNNLMPYVSQVAVGRRKELAVFGNDYDTPDGTGVRDFIHVMDLARGHLAALSLLSEGRCTPVNLGTGKGYSVLEVVKAFEEASGREIPFEIAPRREGDVAACYADPSLAMRLMDWTANHGIDAMCADTWRWQKNNPDGYSQAIS